MTGLRGRSSSVFLDFRMLKLLRPRVAGAAAGLLYGVSSARE